MSSVYLLVGVSLTVVSCQHQGDDQNKDAVPQDRLLREVACRAQKLEALLEEIHRGAQEPREEEREQRKLGEPWLPTTDRSGCGFPA